MLYSIVTADGNELLEGDIFRFLDSLDPVEVRAMVVLRGLIDPDTRRRISGQRVVIGVVDTDPCGISEARNAGLVALSKLSLRPDDWVSFPDDDCTYPTSLHPALARVRAETGADLIVGSYGMDPTPESTVSGLRPTGALIRASSVVIFAAWDLVRQVGGFNRALGVGSGVFAYGEDNDFALRCLSVARSPVEDPSVYVNHPVVRPTSGRNPRGYLTVCALHARSHISLLLFFSGSIVVGGLKRIMSRKRMREFLRHLRQALDLSKLRLAKRAAREAQDLLKSD